VATRLALLLRGINVGGNNKVPMAELRTLLGELGYGEVKTILNSGNAVVTTDDSPDVAEKRVEAAIKKTLGLSIQTMARTHEELAAVVEANPLESVAENPSHYAVGFLRSVPGGKDLERFEAVDADQYAPECWELVGRELFIWYAGGQAKTKLTAVFWEKQLKTSLTARNWNTVVKLLALTAP
jgi:uncharacterized protein (DUF1697 family)